MSLVVPFFNEKETISSFFESLLRVLNASIPNYEVVCIDDGSSDETFALLVEHARSNGRIKVFRLARNFGKEIALSSGLDLSCGDVVIPIDADLQEPPELLPELLEKWRQGYDVVHAVRRSREKDGWSKRVSAKMFYRLFNSISECPIPENAGDFRLMDRCVVEVVRRMPERNRFMKGLLAWPGFRCTRIEFDRPERVAGVGKWKPYKLVGLALDGLTSFSISPLRLATLVGFLFSFIAIVFGCFVVGKKLLFGDPVPGYASLMTVILLMGGIQLLGIGLLGEYLGRIYIEAKRRPLYVVAEAYTKDACDK